MQNGQGNRGCGTEAVRAGRRDPGWGRLGGAPIPPPLRLLCLPLTQFLCLALSLLLTPPAATLETKLQKDRNNVSLPLSHAAQDLQNEKSQREVSKCPFSHVTTNADIHSHMQLSCLLPARRPFAHL